MGQALSQDQHVNCMVCSFFYRLRNIAKLGPVVSILEMEVIIRAFIFYCKILDYCNSLLTCLNNTSLNRLQVVQNAAAKLLTKSSRGSHVTPFLISLHWLPIKFGIQFKLLVIMFRALHGQAPASIKEILQPYNFSRNLRVCFLFLAPVSRQTLELSPMGLKICVAKYPFVYTCFCLICSVFSFWFYLFLFWSYLFLYVFHKFFFILSSWSTI